MTLSPNAKVVDLLLYFIDSMLTLAAKLARACESLIARRLVPNRSFSLASSSLMPSSLMPDDAVYRRKLELKVQLFYAEVLGHTSILILFLPSD